MVMGLSDKQGKPPVLAGSSGSTITPPPLPVQGWAGLGSARESGAQKSRSVSKRSRRVSLFSKLPRSDSARANSSYVESCSNNYPYLTCCLLPSFCCLNRVRKRGKSELTPQSPALLKELEKVTEEKRKEEKEDSSGEKEGSKKKKEKLKKSEKNKLTKSNA